MRETWSTIGHAVAGTIWKSNRIEGSWSLTEMFECDLKRGFGIVIMVVQEQALYTKAIDISIILLQMTQCIGFVERNKKMSHVISGCKMLAQRIQNRWYDWVCFNLHRLLCNKIWLHVQEMVRSCTVESNGKRSQAKDSFGTMISKQIMLLNIEDQIQLYSTQLKMNAK